MPNYWWVTRPKRKLNSVPEVLAIFAKVSLGQKWIGHRELHLAFEEALEEAGLKRTGERRDQTGSGGRTYVAWLTSLGLIFTQESTGQIKLTLAGEAIMEGKSPVEVLKNQVLKYQFPSSYSLSSGVNVSERFKIRPFRFLLKLLNDNILGYLTEEEIAKIVIVKAENESKSCYESIVREILNYRNFGDNCLESDFLTRGTTSSCQGNPEDQFNRLMDTANTIINWLEYTQLAKRDENKQLIILTDKQSEVLKMLSYTPPFIDRPGEHEYFQRKYGLDLTHKKDMRNLANTNTITDKIIAEHKIKQVFIAESLKVPIGKITSNIVDKIVEQTGIDYKLVEETLLKFYPHGAIGSFMTEYFEMAFKGRENANEFERATAEIFKTVFGYDAEHVGSKGLTPDVFILSDHDKHVGIIDNKAYSKYSISNDHHNRMVHNYIPTYRAGQKYPLAFFTYIAGGFGGNIDTQIKKIVDETSVNGSAISISNVIELVNSYEAKKYDHTKLRYIFSLDRQVLIGDLWQ